MSDPSTSIRIPNSEFRNPSKIQLVVFDLGGVLVRIHYSWAEACAAHGIPQPQAIHDEWSIEQLRDAGVLYETGQINYETFLERARGITDLQDRQVRKAFEHWLIEPFPEVHVFVEQLAGVIHTACLSNTNARHWELMHDDSHASLPMQHLTHRVASHLVGSMKPNVGIYEHLESACGLPANALLFFDDKAENVAAAKQRGWQAERIDPTRDTVPQMREHLVRHGVL